MTESTYREFTDSARVRWKVYRVEPDLVSLALEKLRDRLPESARERRTPWLLFESESERRRLSPVPPGWDGSCTQADLEHWCAIAERIPPAPARREADQPS